MQIGKRIDKSVLVLHDPRHMVSKNDMTCSEVDVVI